MAPKAVVTAGAATEHAEAPQLAELLNPEAGLTSDIELKVIRSDMIKYPMKQQNGGPEEFTQKVQVVLQSKIADQYCLGVAKLQKKNYTELKSIQDRFQKDTVWKFGSIKLLNEKQSFVHTACRITVDLRQSKTQAMLQSTLFPVTPEPPYTIADILKLKQMQRFDLMAIPTTIIAERSSGTSLRIADVRLADGSKQGGSTATERVYASLPLTLFFKSEAELTSFKSNVGRTPMVFMALAGSVNKQGKVEVTTLKDLTWWQPAAGSKCDRMAQDAANMCSDGACFTDVASLREFTAREQIDYVSPMATLTNCRLLDPTSATPSKLLGDTTEHLYQLNHVHVVRPSKTDTIKTGDGRLFAQLECWDYSQKITLAFRAKAMLQLAQLSNDQGQEYESQLENNELRHPLLASLRVQIKLKTTDAAATEHSQTQQNRLLSTVVVEAMPCTANDIPNDSVDAIHGLLAGCPPTSERLVAASLDNLQPSPFYNMLVDGDPADKALTLLRFTQRGNGKQLSNGFRIVTDRVEDATADLSKQYATVALCTVEKVPDFSTNKNTTAFAVISKVASPSKPDQHAADLYIEAMEDVPTNQIEAAVQMMKQLRRVSNVHHGDVATSPETAWQQRKCRKLLSYPTIS